MRDPYRKSNPAGIIILIVAAVVLAALGYFGWQRLMQWHERELRSAVEQERQEMARRQAETGQEVIDWLEKNVERKRPPRISDERMREVFGEPVFTDKDTKGARLSDCARLERRIKSFFDYLDEKQDYSPESGSSYRVFTDMMEDLAQSPPLVSDEIRNISCLLRNRAHFFRVLGRDRIRMVIAVLQSEKDVLEHAMADFYKYYVSKKCCEERFRACIPEKTLYEYASFFLDTMSGQSYLMRRDSMVRTLTRYYSVLILNRAIEQGINRHGIDIRPFIAETLDTIRARTDLRLKREYIAQLERLAEDYGLAAAKASP